VFGSYNVIDVRRLTTFGSVAVVLVIICLTVPALGSVRDRFPDPRPATRAAAVAQVAGESPASLGCLTPQIEGLADARVGGSRAALQALAMLQSGHPSGIGRHVFTPDGTRVSFTDDPSAFDRVAPADLDGDGTPDVVQHVADGLTEARGLLVDRMRLVAPEGLEVVLLEIGADLEGYTVVREDGMTIVLDSSSVAADRAVRRSAMHQYAHAVAAASGAKMPREWGEALATWAVMEIDGLDPVTAALLSARLERLGSGLLAGDLELAAGNAVWFAFLKEAYGPSALDRALGRVSDDDLATAFREFHLWSVLVGPRADRYHFPFAEMLAPPRWVSTAEGLPALSVQADPAVAAWGATQIRLVPGRTDGGLGVRFEGEFHASWEVDLLLVDNGGTIRRLALELTPEGWGEATVPLQDVQEALLLVRNVGREDGGSHRYTYAAHRESGYPLEIASLRASEQGGAVDLSWDTLSERALIGFNVLRSRESGGAETVVNPVWIPAVGDRDETTSYQFMDRGTEPGVSYVYRIQAITGDGFTSLSEPLVVRRP
jgi:hypothetical protein